MTDFEVKPATSSEIPALKTIETVCGLSPWTIAAYTAELDRPDAVALTARFPEGETIGFILGRVPIQSGNHAEIFNIGTLPEFRNRGIGTALIKEFHAVCLTRKVSAIWLEARKSNHVALAFYHSHGFVAQGSRRNFYTNPVEDAVVMSLSLH